MHYGLLLATVLLAAGAESPVQKITIKEPEFDSLADALHIIQKSGTIDLSADVPTAQLEIELYRDGKKLATKLESLGVRAGDSEVDKHRIRFALNVVDTDFLTLGDGKKGHCRLQMKLTAGAVTGTNTLDVPKKECNLSKMTTGGSFGPKASTKDRIPVLWMIDSRTASLMSGNAPEAVVKNNPKGNLAIVYIRLSE